MNHNPYSVGEQQTFGEAGLQGLKFEGSVRVMQIIAAALMMGVLSFLLLVLVVTKGEVLEFNTPGLVTLMAAGFALLMMVNHFVIPGVVSKHQLRKLASSGLMGLDEESRNIKAVEIYQTQLIIGLALLEGAAFFNLVALLVGKNGLNLGVVLLLLSLMLMKFPTRTNVSWWIQDKLRELS